MEWTLKLEKALLGARIKVSDEKSFNEVLAYARVLDPSIAPAHNADDEADRNRELIARLRLLADDLREDPRHPEEAGQEARRPGGRGDR